MNSARLLPALRDLYSKHPEYWHHELWEHQHVLFSLGYTDDLADEAEIVAAVEVARGDYPQWRPAACPSRHVPFAVVLHVCDRPDFVTEGS